MFAGIARARMGVTGRGKGSPWTNSIWVALAGMLVLAAIAFAVAREDGVDGSGTLGAPETVQEAPPAGPRYDDPEAKFRHDVRIAAKRLKAAGIVEARRKRSRQLRTVP